MKSQSLVHIARLLLGCALSLPVGSVLADGDFKVLHSFCKKAGCPMGVHPLQACSSMTTGIY
jgi:hypothetical protein